jgi:pyruvate formate lyase activating enzyme
MYEALHYTAESSSAVRCNLCPHQCLIHEGKEGICRVRFCKNNLLYTSTYGRITALHSDPIEKKPLYHFYPGREILSVGTAGCNFRCIFCQNYHLTQKESLGSVRYIEISPRQLAEKAASIPGNLGIAYTYNEPTVFYEMMLETSRIVKESGMKNVVVSNGFISRDPLEELLNEADAFNIDLKAFTDEFYKKYAGGSLQPVLNTLKSIFHAKKHLEITMLVIPTLNDSLTEFSSMVKWIAQELSPEIPLHLSRYFPAWKLQLPPTPLSTINNFATIAGEYLHYVFTGNVHNSSHSSTYCPYCHSVLIDRHIYQAKVTGLTGDSKCRNCGVLLPLTCIS